MSSLIVSLPRESATAATEWAYALTPDGRILASHGTAQAALLPVPRGAGAEVVAIVPVHALAWHRVELPKGIAPGSPRLRAALEGMLEEQLLDEPDALHLALQPGVHLGQAIWVAACDRAWLRQALQALEAADRPVSRIVPEFAPEGDAALYVLGEPEDATVVATSAEGVLALPLSAAAGALLPQLDESAPRMAEPAVAALAEQLLQHKWTLQQAPQRWLQAAQSRWDLSQFEFASAGRARMMKKLTSGWGELLNGPRWRPARWGAALLVLAHLVGLNAWAWKERDSLEAKREAVRRTLTQTFPQVKVIVDAPVQMEREITALRQVTGAASGRDLEALLGALASALPPGRTPSALEFTPGELRAKGLTLSPDELRSVSANLKGLGYGATPQGDLLVVVAEDAR
ncbi:general secretion pathway protein GspL [Caenimonas sedimenti]|uniref:General secretion pathway protein GspL n=1 Tax=Caenimonas sedimenti TaxID=2596921 RepID=A0A562ZFI9_9BURK|nr:type II secretion system protein GspL [Caenimonas sedimenti]TWO65529.1 general secretion pathway protein GspL [Caenimonas sedimenti]